MANSTKPVVYFIFRTNRGPKSTRFGGFITRLKKSPGLPNVDYKTVALEDLTFCIDKSGHGFIYGKDGHTVFEDASFVYFKSWEVVPEFASMVVSYLQAKGIPFEDAAVAHAGVHKPSQTWKLWSHGVPVVPTISSYTVPNREFLESTIGAAPYIVKPAKGEKGIGVLKAETYDALVGQIAKKPEGYIIQPFIENEGDYRVMVYGYEVRGALFRRSVEGSILNNTSQGGTSTYIEAEDIDEKIASLSTKAARAVEHAIAGVDVVVDTDGISRVLEVNQGSQIVTGHFVEEKTKAFSDFMRERLIDRYMRRQPNNRLEVIGRYTYVNLPELGAKHIFAKVDTGAYQSAMHATNIHEVDTPTGKELEFTILEGHHRVEKSLPPSRAQEYERAVVRNSFGIMQVRYVIKTRISINGRMMKTGITLTDRKDMVSPILLGRRFLRGRYLVNVEINGKGMVREV